TTASLAPAATEFLGIDQAGDPNYQSTLINLTSIDLTRALSSRASVFVVGAYTFNDYLGDQRRLVDDHQFSTQVGYKYQLNRQEEMGLTYGFNSIQFPQIGTGTIATHSIQMLYSRLIARKIRVSLGGGPQFASIEDGSNNSFEQINTAAQASLSYQFNKTNLG